MFLHIKCEALSQRTFRNLERNNVQYNCRKCKVILSSESELANKNKEQKVNNKNKAEIGAVGKQTANVDLYNIANMVTNIQQSLDFMNHQFEEFKKDNVEFKKCLTSLNILQIEHNKLKTQVANINYRLNIYEQKELENNAVISGIPLQDGDENIKEIVIEVGRAVGCAIKNDDVVNCYRKKSEKNNNSIIVVQFNNKSKKNELLTKRKEGGNLYLRATKLKGEKNSQIYINEQRTPYSLKLYSEATTLKKKKGYKYVWFKDGAVLVRREADSRVTEIRNEEDIAKLLGN